MTLKGHKAQVNDIAFILGTRLLATSSDDKSLRVWNLDTGNQVGEPLLAHDAGVTRIAASPDGRWIVSGAADGSILVWEVATNETVAELKRVPVLFKGHEEEVWDPSVIFAPDSETFASASLDKTVCVWKRKTGEIVLGPLKVGSDANSVAYSPDGKKLAAGTDKHIIVWNTKTGKELLKIEQRAFRVAFTPDGLRLISGNTSDIQISDATTGAIIKQFDAHTNNFISLAIAPNGTKFATTSYDKTTRFFDLTTFEPIGKLLEHPKEVLGLAFSKDSQLIATGCADKLVRTWTVPLSESELQQVSESSHCVILHADLSHSPLRKFSMYVFKPIDSYMSSFDSCRKPSQSHSLAQDALQYRLEGSSMMQVHLIQYIRCTSHHALTV
jgi:WD40 repeat protein